jgi:hypothetical protein
VIQFVRRIRDHGPRHWADTAELGRLCGESALDTRDFVHRMEDLTREDIRICENCLEPAFDVHTTTAVEGGGVVCESCIDDSYLWSDHRGYYVHCDNWETGYHDYHESEDEDEDSEDNDGLCEYSARADQRLDMFRTLPTEKSGPKTTWLGVELEVERRRNAPPDLHRHVLNALGRTYALLKRDGSLSSSGFEIVTAAATLDFHRKQWGAFFAENGPQRHLKAWNTGTCGIHVHVGRNAFTPLTLGKFLVFYNSPRNKPFIQLVAGRSSEQWAAFDANKDNIKCGKKPHDSGRYTAVNLVNPATVEVRIFRGNVNPIGFFKCLEFVAASLQFCQDTSMMRLSRDDFLTWFRQPRNVVRYPHLATWLQRTGLITLPRPVGSRQLKTLALDEAA